MRLLLPAVALLLAGAVAADDGPDPAELAPGGTATVRDTGDARAFSLPSASLALERQFDFKLGDGVFRKLWVSSPSSTTSSDGLGPLYNARGCQSCHLRDGRGRPPEPGEPASSLLVRLSVPPGQARGPGPAPGWLPADPDPTYGLQLQTFGIAGHPAEGRVRVDWTEQPVPLAGGETASLRRPAWHIADWGYGPPAPGLMLSPRVAPPMIGLGLLEAVPAAAIRAGADPEDHDRDGISGRAADVWSAHLGIPALGRFGWKAQAPTLPDQVADAFAADMGLSTRINPAHAGECTAAQADCRTAPHGAPEDGGPEVDPRLFELVVFYARNLGVPARAAPTPQVMRGRALFRETGCAACHRPSFTTGAIPGRPEHSHQRIWPYTDLLLHDMGEGLADHRPEGAADGREWRTPPLWGLGHTLRVSGHTQLLHDGRARSVLEAILWHGGEAQAARDAVAALPRAERAALLAFLESL
ncbi:di-heme oxidoreductase family protein [Falsiroseomonas selenitidurans]|uniref:C-type cytochrome n=1 Tax=Falsiroseomonas selenitidurans TaxID=2716335 RepID=A0ABX1E3F6_9PROT|nr:di-heme oxidoredictase family protein [Falsiroseomonas selenitidurans]NKC31230.1 c-type cytochrome [Falsiroseomonas selenitidurans]